MTVMCRGWQDEIVEDLVGDRLVEDAAVAKLNHVVLQRLELEAHLVGHVGDADLAEVRQAGLGAHRRKLRTTDVDPIVTSRAGIGERLDGRARHVKIVAFRPIL
jgi:hypothetical protein